MSKFSVTRADAAQELWVSTRTVDRYVQSWKLAYKKIANKILLDAEAIRWLKSEFQTLYQHNSTEIVNEWSVKKMDNMSNNLEKIIDEKIDKFFLVFQEKDQKLEEKNKVIFMLQQRVSELENKISTMVALPDLNEQKQLATIEKSKLEDKIKQLSGAIRGEKTKNSMFLAVLVFVIVIAIFWYLSYVKWWLTF